MPWSDAVGWNHGGWNIPAASGGGGGYVNSETTSWVAAVNAFAGASVVGTTRGNLVDTMFTDLKVGSALSLIDYLWIHALADENSNEALIDFKVGQAATVNGSGTLDANGWTGSGGFIDTGVPLPVHFYSTGTSTGALGVAILNNRTTANGSVAVGVLDTCDTFIQPYQATGPALVFAVTNSSYPTYANTGTKGLWLATRDNSTTSSLYGNGSSTPLVSGASNAIGGGTNGRNLYIGGFNTGSGSNLSTDQIVATVVADTGTGAQMATIMNAVNTLLTNLPVAKNVY